MSIDTLMDKEDMVATYIYMNIAQELNNATNTDATRDYQVKQSKSRRKKNKYPITFLIQGI